MDLAGLSLAVIMRELYERSTADFPTVCAYVLDTGVRGLAQPLEPATLPPESVAELVGGWTGSIWIGQLSDYELAWTEQKRIVLVSTKGVPPPHQGFYETVGNALEFVRIHGDWELHVIGRLFDCQDSSAPLPDGIGTLARRIEGAAGYFPYEVEEVVDDDHPSDDQIEQWYSILEVADHTDWPPAVDLPAIASLLTETAREHWSADFACVNVTRRPVDSGVAGTGLTTDSPLPEAFLRIFDELRYDPEQATLRLIGTRNIVLAWVESYDDAGWVTAAEFVRSEDGNWSERTWVSMYGCDALGG